MSASNNSQQSKGSESPTTPQSQDLYHLSNLPKNHLWFWIGQKMEPEAPLFNMPMAITIRGAVDHDRFNRAFREVVNRSDALRSVIDTIDGIPQRRVLPSMDYDVELIDLSAESDPEKVFEEWAHHRCRQVFDMGERMFDAVLFKFSEEEYVWYWCQHHLVCDGWSTALVYRYVSDFYGADLNAPESLPELPSFEDYALREREYRDSPEHEASRQFWEDQLAESLDSLTLYGKSSHEHGSTEVLRVTRDLGQARTDGLQQLAARKPFAGLFRHMSVFQLFSTCLLAYLRRITGNEVLSIGTLYHNRASRVDKETIGFYMEMAPLRVRIDADDSFTDLFQKVRSASQSILKHYRFAPGNPINNRSYDVALNYNNASYPPFSGMPMSIRWLHAGAWYPHEPLAIQIHDFGETGSLTAAFDFNCGMFDEDYRERIIAHFFHCIDALIADPEQKISDFALMDGQESSQVLQDFSHSSSAAVPATSLHALFAEQSARSPDKVAVYSNDGSYTYAEVEERSNRLAHYLLARGVEVGDRVGVSLRRHPDMIVAMLGILKSGCGYVPLDPDYPAERLTFMMSDSDIKALITQAALVDELPFEGQQILKIDTDWGRVAEYDAGTPAVNVTPGDLAYVIYTSGSTGRSKGVLIEHRSIVNYTLAAIDDYEISSNDVTLQLASISFDTAGEEIYPTLATGGTLYLADDRMFASARDFVEICEQEKLTFLDLPTAFWHQIATAMADEDLQLPECTRLLIIGGERALPQHVATWLERDRSGCRLLNTYGPTETTIVASWCELTPENSSADQEVPIGRPVRNLSCYVLDKHLQPVPVGVTGELHIGGEGLARGYLNQPEMTDDKFIPDPFSDKPGARLYKSGDLVRFRRDGLLEYRDRVDDQVKVRGYRIELGEVENALMRIDGVDIGAVLMHEAQPGDKRIVAYYVLGADSHTTPTELRNGMREHLPDYMIPQHFVEIDALPMTPNNKVDRKALPNPFGGAEDLHVEHVELENDAERRIAAVWQQVLQTDKISRHANFFDLGGHSLLMMQLIAMMEKELGFAADPRMVVMQDLAQIATEYQKQCGSVEKPVDDDQDISVPLFKRVLNATRSLMSR